MPIDKLLADYYIKEYKIALEFCDDGRPSKAIEYAKINLINLALPPYWQGKNCILIVSEKEDWDEAELYRKAAEKACKGASEDGTDEKLVQELRVDLDYLAEEFRLAEEGGEFDEEEDEEAVEDMEDENANAEKASLTHEQAEAAARKREQAAEAAHKHRRAELQEAERKHNQRELELLEEEDAQIGRQLNFVQRQIETLEGQVESLKVEKTELEERRAEIAAQKT